MKILLRNNLTGQEFSYADFDIEVFVGDNDEILRIKEYLPDLIDNTLPYLDVAE